MLCTQTLFLGNNLKSPSDLLIILFLKKQYIYIYIYIQYWAKVLKAIIDDYCALFLRYFADISAKYPTNCHRVRTIIRWNLYDISKRFHSSESSPQRYFVHTQTKVRSRDRSLLRYFVESKEIWFPGSQQINEQNFPTVLASPRRAHGRNKISFDVVVCYYTNVFGFRSIYLSHGTNL